MGAVVTPQNSATTSIANSSEALLRGPLQNPLSDYATYNYVLSLSALTREQSNDPDGTYMSGDQTVYICKTGNADPNNRVKIAHFGRHDFFITNLELDSMIGFRDGKNTNVFSLTFDVFEPYSVGLFLMALQLSAAECGHDNYHLAPYLLTVEFRGNKENGIMQEVPKTKKYIPIIINAVDVEANESGCRYRVSANVQSSFAQSILYSKITNDLTIKGKTVQDILQSLSTSLQFIINQKKTQDAKKNDIVQADQILIIFPENLGLKRLKSKNNKPTINQAKISASTVFEKLGTTSQQIQNLGSNQIQSDNVNLIGKASLAFSAVRKGDTSLALYDKVLKDKKLHRSSVTIDESEGAFKFAQGTNITDIINEVILNSDYAINALKEESVDALGNRMWWRIDTQQYFLGENNKSSSNVPATVTVYRVVPYKVHTSILTSPGLKPYGTDKLNEQVPKVYNYIYSGNADRGSTEILKFDIKYQFGWLVSFLADKGNKSQDTETQDSRSSSDPNKEDVNKNIKPTPAGSNYSLGAAASPAHTHLSTNTPSGQNGGATGDTPDIRNARLFQSLITNPIDMIELDMEIIGDPFWVSSSGMGNYSSNPSANSFINEDYSVNWQTGEVYIHVNFKSPIDINQATGLYQFPKVRPDYESSIQFKGVYRVTTVTSTFRDGMFTQRLKGYRVNNQFQDVKAQKSNTLNNSS